MVTITMVIITIIIIKVITIIMVFTDRVKPLLARLFMRLSS